MGRSFPGRLPARTRWALVALLAVVIFVASVLPGSAGVAPPPGPGPAELVGADKWLHALAYAGLAGALAYALDASGRFADATERSTPAVVVLALGLAVAFGLAVEVVQAPIPTRRFELLDVAANVTGATVAVVGWWVARRFPAR